MSAQVKKSSSEVTHRRKSSSISTTNRKDGVSRRASERQQVLKIQNYVIYRKTIGAGSMGKVKLAECLDDTHKQKYAVKIMPKVDLVALPNKPTKPKDPKDTPEEREQRTIREMAIMRLLRHPNICQLKEYIAEGDKYYMFLEYVDGGQLLDYIIKHGKLREKQARKFARQIVSALDYCHRNSIVHRDLKIENILITQSEQLKIIDFGLSNVYSPTEQLNTFCGSLYFAAPELLKAKEYTGPEVDVWSFGVVLYVLVCGRVPFDDTNLPALHEKIKSGVVEEYPDHLSKECLDLLSKIFVVNPKERITLSAIQAHPWMNKGYEEPIKNYLPHRQPLESIDMEIVQGMHGFGLGQPDAIHAKLQKIVSSAAYQVAALKIDQNFQKKVNDDQSLAAKPRWRRTLSTKRKVQVHDDFQSLPAMYDPLVSIYYLVKERKESDMRKTMLLNAESSPITISRSTSTLVTNTPPIATQSPLVRRRTFDASKKLPELPAAATAAAAGVTIASEKKKASNRLSMSFDLFNKAPHPTPSKSETTPARRTTLLRQKSLQTMKKFGLKLHGGSSSRSATATPATEGDNLSSSSSTTTNETSNKNRPSSIHSSSKSHWLKLDLNNKNNGSQSAEKRQSGTSTASSSQTNSRPAWRKMSISSRGKRLSIDNSTGNLPTPVDPMLTSSEIENNEVPVFFFTVVDPPTLRITPSKSEGVSFRNKKRSEQPKSLFHFNRAHLFRVTPDEMMMTLQKVLKSLKIQCKETGLFTLRCQCSSAVWTRFVNTSMSVRDESLVRDSVVYDDDPNNLEFTVMVYEA
ncbi:hypothetical protein INT47_000443, partial [Mucor saturninus]